MHVGPTQTNAKYSEFSDPRLVAIYDVVCPIDGYAKFFLELAKEHSAKSIIDIGCGTGLLSHEFATRGYSVIGVEPAPEMLRLAEHKYGAEAQWIVGSTEKLNPKMQADLAIMAGHVAQFFLEDQAWQAALESTYRALKPGGYVVFESRNPQVQPFTDWPTKAKPGELQNTPLGSVAWWPENLKFAGGYARYDIHYLFLETAEEAQSRNELRFRTKEEIATSLKKAGFDVEHVYGDWDRSTASSDSLEMIFVAKKPV